MSDNSKKVLFLREEYADGEGTFKYGKRSKYEGLWKMVKKMDLEYIHYPIGVNISVSIKKD